MARADKTKGTQAGGTGHHVSCAVYTRKSTEEGLEQDFNSLDAQREACEAFIRSQKAEGWTPVQTAYDDGGISGGTLERPALQRLLADIRAGRVDIVVVYKVDRLTRSLADFAKLVETFDEAGASFVSVTQAFNTSTSMGRLTLNMLLSFAQFEREVTAERIRDKIAASKRKGIWMGGPVPLGYDAIERKLVINEAEAQTVRLIFERYLALGSIRHLQAELNRKGIVSKQRMTKTGTEIGGRPFGRGALAQVLKNPVYIGEVQHKGERFPGQHDPIIERETWDAVERQLDMQRVERRVAANATEPSPLAGMIFDAAGRPLTPSHASKGPARIRYRYYVSNRLMTGLAADHPDAWRLPAEPVERAARDALVGLLRDRSRVAGSLAASASAVELRHRLARVEALAQAAEGTDAPALRDLLLRLSARIEIGDDALTISVSAKGMMEAADLEGDSHTPDERLTATHPLILRKRGAETRLVLGDRISLNPEPTLIRLVADAHRWMHDLRAGAFPSIRALARDLDLDHRHVTRTLPLAFLAPDIVAAIIEGRQPAGITVTTLKRIDQLPIGWEDQRRLLGFVED